jgi:hypothetical protein
MPDGQDAATLATSVATQYLASGQCLLPLVHQYVSH